MSNKKYYFPEKKVDKKLFVGEKYKHITKYNLPQKVEYCKICLYTNQRPTRRSEQNINKNEDIQETTRYVDGICEACRIKDKWKDVDWNKREHEFKKILDQYRSRNGHYDVVVPGSGGKDSFYVAHQLKHKYNMNPITVTFAPYIYTDWGWKNMECWSHAGLENYLNTPNQKIYRLLSRIALENFFHPWHPWTVGHKAFPVKFAKNFNIPLVIYGDSPGEYGQNEYNADYNIEWHTCEKKENVLFSGENVETLKSFGLKEYDLEPFWPMTKEEYRNANIRVLAYSFFNKWHPQGNYYYSVEHSDPLKPFAIAPERTYGSHSKYCSIDDVMDHIMFVTTYVKFGIGRASADVSQEIRNGDISKAEGIKLIKKFDHEFPENISEQVFNYLSIDEKSFGSKIYQQFERPKIDREYFDQMSDYFRPPHLWKKTNEGMELRNKIEDYFSKKI